MPVVFDSWTLKETDEALAFVTKDETTGQLARQYYFGDHWQNSAGWIGQRPDPNDPDAQAMLLAVQAAFVFENAVKSVSDRHTGGVLGREPTFALTVRRPLPPGEAPSDAEQATIAGGEAALTSEWWDRRSVPGVLRTAVRDALLCGRGVVRLYVPQGLRGPGGQVAVNVRPGEDPLLAAMRIVYCDALDPATACVYEDDATKREVGIWRYTDRDGKGWAELTYLAEDDLLTTLRVLGEDGSSQSVALDVGARLLIHQLRRTPLITQGVLQLQRVLNHTRTIMSRNVHMAGYRQQSYLNAAPPGHWADASGAVVPIGTPGAQWQTGTLPVGAGTVQFVQGNPIYDKEGTLTGYTTASAQIADPVDPDGLIKVRDSSLLALLDEVHQRHVAMSSDAQASGEARKQARAEYAADLGITALPANDQGRWVVEASLRLGCALVGDVARFAEYRPEFAVRVDAGPIGADELAQHRADYQAGLLSQEGAMEANGVADVQAELARLRAEEDAKAQAQDASLLRLSGSAQGQFGADDNANPADSASPNTPGPDSAGARATLAA